MEKVRSQNNIERRRNTDISRESKAGDEMGDSIDLKEIMTPEDIEREQHGLFSEKIKSTNTEKKRFIFVHFFYRYFCCAAIVVQ